MSRSELVAHVSTLYYKQGLTQTEIAKRIHTSRSTISRLLQEGRDAKIVEFVIHYPHERLPQLERQLRRRFELREIRVLAGQGRGYEETLRRVGSLAASYLSGVIEDDMVLGISWGTSLYRTVEALQVSRDMSITVVQMIGAAGSEDPLIDGPDLARLLARVCGGRALSLHAPLMVDNATVREALLKEPHIEETLSLARGADIALVGIGTVVRELSSWLRAGYVGEEFLDRLQAKGAVGDICGWHYDAYGQLLDIDLNQRLVGIELEALHAIDRVVGVAAGEAKVDAVLGALRGRHVNTLITDEAVARKLCSVSQ